MGIEMDINARDLLTMAIVIATICYRMESLVPLLSVLMQETIRPKLYWLQLNLKFNSSHYNAKHYLKKYILVTI
jgi:hypothetical protein